MKSVIYRIMLVILISMILFRCDKDSSAGPEGDNLEKPAFVIEFLGHSSLRLITSDSLEIITDPFGNSIPGFYTQPDSLVADIVTISHSHADHNQSRGIEGDPVIIKTAETDTIGPLIIEGYLSEHGKWNGASMGSNIIFVFRIGDAKIVHLGENRAVTEPEILAAIQDADVLIAPVGEIASLSVEELDQLIRDTGSGTVIPTHCSLSESNRYYGSSTADEYVASLSPDVPVIHLESLDVFSDMPRQVAVLTPVYAK
jgi:L-ascorbate metabolism protein UlaG (beta-lactamase superfamily)